MHKKFNVAFLTILFALVTYSNCFSYYDKIIDDINFRFTITLPTPWYLKEFKETPDKEGITYTIWTSDTTVKMTLQVMAFKLGAVKNLDDFIYNMEKDITLGIPQKSGEYSEKDFGNYDMKAGTYIDNNFYEEIYYYRTKLTDAPHNYVYMVRFISTPTGMNESTKSQVKEMVDSFKSTIE